MKQNLRKSLKQMSSLLCMVSMFLQFSTENVNQMNIISSQLVLGREKSM